MKDRMMKPRNGHTFHVGIVARISGCSRQKEVSLEDQIDHGKEETLLYYDEGTPEYHVVSTKGKGERLDRPELTEIESLIRSRVLDLLVIEDLGRLVRGTEAARLCGIAVDHGVQVVVPNDCIVTHDLSWEEDVISACRDHVGHNAQTSKRIKHKMMNRFRKKGEAKARPIFGYIVPSDAKSYKVDAVANIAHQQNPRMELLTNQSRFLRAHLQKWSSGLTNAAFLCVDSMAARKSIWKQIKHSAQFLCDGRLGLEVIRVLVSKQPATDTFYPSTLAAVPPRASPYEVVVTAKIAAVFMVAQFSRWICLRYLISDQILSLMAQEITISGVCY